MNRCPLVEIAIANGKTKAEYDKIVYADNCDRSDPNTCTHPNRDVCPVIYAAVLPKQSIPE